MGANSFHMNTATFSAVLLFQVAHEKRKEMRIFTKKKVQSRKQTLDVPEKITHPCPDFYGPIEVQ